MLKTFYMDHQAVMAIALDYQAAEACAALDDFGLTICNRREEFEQLASSDLFLGGGEVGVEFGRKFYAVVHRRSSVLPETAEDPCPVFNPAHRRMRGEWWRRSKAFHRHAGRYGWPGHSCSPNGPLEQFLKKHFNVPAPWFLTDAQYAAAWKAVSWGPPQAIN